MSLLHRVTQALRRRPPDTPESRRIQMALLESHLAAHRRLMSKERAGIRFAQTFTRLGQPERCKKTSDGWFSD